MNVMKPLMQPLIDRRDPHWDKVVSLLHFDGDLRDEAGLESYAFNSLSSFTDGKYGEGINPQGDYRKRVECNLVNGVPLLDGRDFTVEVSFKRTGVPTVNAPIFCFSNDLPAYTQNFKRLALFQLTDNRAALEFGINSDVVTLSFTHPLGEFVDWAVCRSGTDILIFADGVVVHTLYNAPMYANTLTKLTTGGFFDWVATDARDRTAVGVIDEFRITNGVARYTKNFTPPNRPFPNR